MDVPLLTWTAAHAVAAADTTLAQLRAIDVPILPGNRLVAARQLVDRTGSELGGGNDLQLRRRLEEAHRTIIKSYLIVYALGQRTNPLFHQLSVLLSGATLPESDSNTASRDLQFELVVAAVLILGGVLDLHIGEPDLRIRVGDAWLGIAIKRVTKSHRFGKQVAKAIRQVRNQNIYSVIVLQADWPDRPAQPEELDRTLNALLADQVPRLRSQATNGLVFGAIAFATSWEWHPGPAVRLAGITVHTPAHFVAGVPPSEVDVKLRQLGANVFNAATHAVAKLNPQALRLTVEEALAMTHPKA
jgi:hypothetical protein